MRKLYADEQQLCSELKNEILKLKIERSEKRYLLCKIDDLVVRMLENETLPKEVLECKKSTASTKKSYEEPEEYYIIYGFCTYDLELFDYVQKVVEELELKIEMVEDYPKRDFDVFFESNDKEEVAKKDKMFRKEMLNYFYNADVDTKAKTQVFTYKNIEEVE